MGKIIWQKLEFENAYKWFSSSLEYALTFESKMFIAFSAHRLTNLCVTCLIDYALFVIEWKIMFRFFVAKLTFRVTHKWVWSHQNDGGGSRNLFTDSEKKLWYAFKAMT